jgi:heme-degrading monooxygenase HmoA
MYAVIFEVFPGEGQYEAYLEIAAGLLADAQAIEGFISIERFSSLVNEGKILSLSFWESEESIQTWREHTDHRKAQTRGRYQIFDDYRLCVAQVVRDYGKYERDQAPQP